MEIVPNWRFRDQTCQIAFDLTFFLQQSLIKARRLLKQGQAPFQDAEDEWMRRERDKVSTNFSSFMS